MAKKYPRGRTFSRAEAVSGKKRHLEYLMVAVSVVIVIGLTILQTRVVRLDPDVPISHSVLIFALININIIFLFFLLVLILRNLYKIFFEQRQVTGAQLRTKLVVAFISLSLVPAALLFYTAMRFITTGHDYWFGSYVEQSLMESLDLADYSLQMHERRVVEFGQTIATRLAQTDLLNPESQPLLRDYLGSARRDFGLSMLEIYSPDLRREAANLAGNINPNAIPDLPAEFFKFSDTRHPPGVRLDSDRFGDLVRAVWPLPASSNGANWFLVAGYRSHLPLKDRIEAVSRSLSEYRQLKRLHEPIRFSHYLALSIVALLSVFISTWIGLHLAKQITGPIIDLAEGTNRVADGDYDFTLDLPARPDEVGTLVTSFNRMTRDLKAHKSELTLKNQELLDKNTELDQRRRYMEIILQNVAAGVVSADARGVITTINHSAEEIFRVPAARILGRHFDEVMSSQQKVFLDEMIRSAKTSPRGSAEKHIRMRIGGRGLSLHIHLTLLRDESGQDLGLVIVFDDLYELEKAQRVAVWREVARRIAHEIKNPLTPIQLSAQRLRKRYENQLGDDGRLLDECTTMIIRQVDELKRLVNEFSNFARMPEVAPSPNDLSEIVDETLVMFAGAHRDISFQFNKDSDIPVFNLDREQMKRALINLLDNAVAAVNGPGTIEISLNYDKMLRMVRLQVADDGVGINPADRGRLFEPYFSTKKSGTGLGLAIVRTIVTDHDGFVRIQDNDPKGTRVIIELPVKQ